MKLSLSYGELNSLEPLEIAALAKAGDLTEDTILRAAHLLRFHQAIWAAMPNPKLKIEEVLSEEELAEIWLATEDPDFTPGPPPSLQ